jgi:tRNA A37 threonylcarbamoyladenosine biosynthesis protein TsaE
MEIPIIDERVLGGIKSAGTSIKSRLMDLNKRSYVICLSGFRGSGKTTMATFLCEREAHFNKRRILSNFTIEFKVRNGFGHLDYYKSEDLDLYKLLNFDTDYRGSIIVLDEAPQVINRLATMTWNNRLIDLFLQQLRKNLNSFLYCSQNPMWVDKSVQFQTDVRIDCTDANILNPNIPQGVTILSEWFDMSGQWTGHIFNEKYPRIALKMGFKAAPIWNSFDTSYVRDPFASFSKVEIQRNVIKVGNAQKDDPSEPYLEEAASILQEHLQDDAKIKKQNLFDKLGDMALEAKREIGIRLGNAGARRVGHNLDTYDLTNFDMQRFLGNES